MKNAKCKIVRTRIALSGSGGKAIVFFGKVG
jgi:hypothetical protein